MTADDEAMMREWGESVVRRFHRAWRTRILLERWFYEWWARRLVAGNREEKK